MKEETTTLGHKKYNSHPLFFCGVRDTNRNGGRRRQTAILTHNFLLAVRRDAAPAVVEANHSLALSVTDRISSGRKLRLP